MTDYRGRIVQTTNSKVRIFLHELAEQTNQYRSIHNLTEHVEHQYHGRFLIELIQNAHDALSNCSDSVAGERRIEIAFRPNEEEYGVLYAANDGLPFSDSNFENLSQLGQSDKDPQKFIGNKGIGFRSVLEISDAPEIYSRSVSGGAQFDGYCFAFSPAVIASLRESILKLYKDETDIFSPFGNASLIDGDERLFTKLRAVATKRGKDWISDEIGFLSPYLLPFPTASLGNGSCLEDFERRGLATVIRLPLKDPKTANMVCERIAELNGETVLFLGQLKILVLDSGSSRRVVNRAATPVAGSKFRRESVVIGIGEQTNPEEYSLWTRTVSVDASEAFRKVVGSLKGRWTSLKEVGVTLAVRQGDVPAKGTFSIFLPTLLHTGCAVHINAPFFGDMSRTSINFGVDFNRLLLQAAARLAVLVIRDELAEHGLDEARMIIDVLAPLADSEAARRWLVLVKAVADTERVSVDGSKLYLSDGGWKSLKDTFLLPKSGDVTVITSEALRSHAKFAVYRRELDSRVAQIEALSASCGLKPFPSSEQVAQTVEAIAKNLHQLSEGTDWNAFWNDAHALFGGDATSLANKQVLLGQDGNLHANGTECAVFFIPRRGSIDDEEIESELAISDVPSGLRLFVAMLNEHIMVYDENNARAQTKIRKFLDTKLVNRFRVEDIFTAVLIPRTPKLPIALDDRKAALCKDILSWSLRLIANLVDRGKGEKSLRQLRGMPVPCAGGWYPLGETSFGPEWKGTLGEATLRYLDGVNSPASAEAKNKLLISPSHALWDGAGDTHQELLTQAGVFNGLRLRAIASDEWISNFQASHASFQLPEVPPPVVESQFWANYRTYAAGAARLMYSGWYEYRVQALFSLPGFDNYTNLAESTRMSLSELLLGSMANWEAGWTSVTIRKEGGASDSFSMDSPLAFALKRLPWLAIPGKKSIEWSKPEERWHVPSGVLASGRARFAHLRPLPGPIAQQLDSDPRLSSVLQGLGMPRFDIEARSASGRLLGALALSVTSEEVIDSNVLLGQVRDAWGAFYPDSTTAAPLLLLVRQGHGPLDAIVPSNANPTYLPDHGASFMALERFELPVIAINLADSRRLMTWFKSTYGDAVRPASALKVIPIVGGRAWENQAELPLQNSDLEWLIPTLLTLVAFHGPQAKGPNSQPFRERVEQLKAVKLCWVSDLAVALQYGDTALASPPTPALWNESTSTLLVSEECRSSPGKLSESLAHLLEREDLEYPIRLVLGRLASLEPDTVEVVLALGELKLGDRDYRDAREAWRGDLGHAIRLIRPLASLLNPDANIGILVDSDTEEDVVEFLKELDGPTVQAQAILAMARTSSDMFEFGKRAYSEFGDRVQLARWNATLVALGEKPIENASAQEQLDRHLDSVRVATGSLLATLIRRQPALGAYKKLSEELNGVSCPSEYKSTYWEVTFGLANRITLPFFEKWGATGDELASIAQARDADDFITRLSNQGIDTAFEPLAVARDNERSIEDAAMQLQTIAVAWAVARGDHHAGEWERLSAKIISALKPMLEQTGYTRLWNVEEVFSLLKGLPEDITSVQFRDCLSRVTGFNELSSTLGLTAEDLSKAQERLNALLDKERLKRRLVSVCGSDFDSSDDNLKRLWTHIQINLPDAALDTLGPANLDTKIALEPIAKVPRGKPSGGTPGGGGPPRPSKAKENVIGMSGEIHAYRMLHKQYGASVVHPDTWKSEFSRHAFPDNAANDGLGCDFVLNLKTGKFFIEVKSSEGDDANFRLGSSEIRLAQELATLKRRRKGDKFVVLRVLRALSSSPAFQVLPNPFDPHYSNLFAIEAADARVRYRSK